MPSRWPWECSSGTAAKNRTAGSAATATFSRVLRQNHAASSASPPQPPTARTGACTFLLTADAPAPDATQWYTTGAPGLFSLAPNEA